jgi:hypothetical protein
MFAAEIKYLENFNRKTAIYCTLKEHYEVSQSRYTLR